MIPLLPRRDQTIVVALSAGNVIERLRFVTRKDSLVENTDRISQYFFNGWVGDGQFRISLKVTKPNNYLPIVRGRIESTSTGSILFLSFQLFPSTKMFITFWSLFILLTCIFTAYPFEEYLYSLIAFGLLFVVEWVAWKNFLMQVSDTREAIIKVLS